MNRISILINCVFACLLCSCAVSPAPSPGADEPVEYCIPPLVGSSYPVEFDYESEQEIVLPKAPWRFVSDIPEESEGLEVIDKDHKIFVPEEEEDLWVISRLFAKDLPKAWLELWVYSPSEDSWQNKPLAMDSFTASGLYYLNLVQSKDGEIYAFQTDTPYYFDPNHIAVYDKEAEVFQEIMFDESLPDGEIIYDLDQNLFWSISRDGEIYRIDPDKKTVQEYFRSENAPPLSFINKKVERGSIYATITQEGSVFKNLYYRTLIYKFDISERKEEIIYNPIKDDDYFNSIFFDRAGNLWLDDHSMMTAGGEWYQITRSPIFITDRIKEMNDQYIWLNPEIVLESSNGYLWFRSTNGISWFDPSGGKWCWVTNEYALNPVEGNHKDVWMGIQGKLYLYPID